MINVVEQKAGEEIKTDILHDAIISFWKIASYGDLNELKKHSAVVKDLCVKNSDHQHAQHYITLVNAIEGFFESQCEAAEENFVSILPPRVTWSHKEIEAMARLFCGGNYRSLGKFDKALEHLLEVPRLVNPNGIYATYALLAYYFLGEIHVSLNELKAAEEYYKEGLEFGKDNVEESARFRLYSGLGNLFLTTKQYEKSEEMFQSAISAAMPGSQLARSWYDMAVYYDIVNELDKAIEYCIRSFELRVASNLHDAASTSQIQHARLLMKKGEIARAIGILQQTLESTRKYNAIVKTQTVYKHLSECYEQIGDWKNAYESFRKFEEIKSGIFLDQQTKFFKIKNEEIVKQKELVEILHAELKDSIRYALRIQQAILPTETIFREIFPESFVIYKPRDVVSGDFYWIEEISCKEGDLVLFAVADCTGHGVPGAMVSIICVNALNRAVREFDLTDPAEILNKTRELVIASFERSGTGIKDGMDISLCSLNRHTLELKWAGANNPLYLLPSTQGGIELDENRKGFIPAGADTFQMVEFKPEKQPIGQHSTEAPFITRKVNVQPGDMIVLFSDGFPDQFGGKSGKKYKYKTLKENLCRIRELDPARQREYLENSFDRWKGNHEQVDDVCLVGVRVPGKLRT